MSEAKRTESPLPKETSKEPPAGKPLRSVRSGGSIRLPHVSEHDTGLKELYSPPKGVDIVCDIIAVHGIGVDPKETWIQRPSGINWLQNEDMLPKKIPNARIMTFNYNSIWFGDRAVKESCEGISRKLLYDISGLEAEEGPTSRPMILLGHCFGGLVIESAYSLASQFAFEWPGVAERMMGIVFLGTPHHGIREDNSFVSQGEMFAKYLKKGLEDQGVSPEIQQRAIQSMVQEDPALKATVNRFEMIIRRANPPPLIFCFFETMQTKVSKILGMDGKLEMVVEETSGSFGAFGKQGLASDHFNLNKYDGPTSDHFKNVSREIIKMVKDVDERVKENIPPISREANLAPRDDILGKIKDRFSNSIEVVLWGAPGSGKTHIAVAYAHMFREENPRGQVLWVYANSAEVFERSFVGFAEILHINKEILKENGTIQSVFQHLKENLNEDWLMVVDGVEDAKSLISTEPQTAGKPLLDFIPNGLGAHVIITTCSESLASGRSEDDLGRHFHLKALDVKNTSKLLLGREEQSSRRTKWVESMRKELDGSPGALALSLAYIDATGKGSVADRNDFAAMEGFLGSLKLQKGPTNGLCRVWQLLYHYLESKDDKSQQIRHFMLLVGAIEVQFIPRVFFSREEVKTHIPRLVEYGIVEPSNGGRDYSVTTQIRHCIQDWLCKNEDLRRSIEGKIIRKANERFETSTAAALLPTVLAALKLKPETSEDKKAMAELLFKIGSNYIENGKIDKGTRELNEFLVSTKRTASKSESIKKLAAEATEKLKKAKEQPPEPEKSVQEEAQKAKTGKNAKNFRAGYAARELEKMEKLDSEWDNQITVYAASEAARLGLPYTQTVPKGKYKREDTTVMKYDKPTDLYRRIHDWYQKSNDAREEEKIRSKYNLACALDNRRNYKEAEQFYASSLEFYENRLQDDADDDAKIMYWRVLNNLANIYATDGKIEKAEEALQEALEGQTYHLDPNHPETLTTRHNMALILQQKGKYDDADGELRKVLVAQANVLGQENEKTLQTLTSIARNAWVQGNLMEAKQMLEDNYAMQIRVLGKDHWQTIETRDMLEELRKESKTLAAKSDGGKVQGQIQ